MSTILIERMIGAPAGTLDDLLAESEREGSRILNVDPYAAAAKIGRVRRLYVHSACRRLGAGRQLVLAVLDAARGRFDLLRLRTTNPAAAQLYESLGFRPSTDTADCTHVLPLASPVPPMARA